MEPSAATTQDALVHEIPYPCSGAVPTESGDHVAPPSVVSHGSLVIATQVVSLVHEMPATEESSTC